MLRLSSISSFGLAYRHLGRYRQILAVMFKYGFEDLIDSLKLDQHLQFGLRLIPRRKKEQVTSLSRACRVRMCLVELGPTFVKLGQIFSTRPDLIPADFVEELLELQDHVPPVSFEQARQVVEAELGGRLEDRFTAFDKTPLAAASLGQVHRARIRGGAVVAVKVQRPGISQTVQIDLEILTHLASLVERTVQEARFHRPGTIVQEFRRAIERELQYGIEARNMERFAAQFAGDERIHVPAVYRDLSTDRVLTMEYIDGIKASRVDALVSDGLDPGEIARRGADLTLEQLFTHSFFHADPHPGNIVVLPGCVICYLDYGMMGRLRRRTRDAFADFLTGTVTQDEERAARALLQLTTWEQEPDRAALEADLADLAGSFVSRPVKDVVLGRLLHRMIGLAATHRLRIRPDMFLALKVLASIDSLGRTLDSGFDCTAPVARVVRRVRAARFAPARVWAELAETAGEFLQLLQVMPAEVRLLLKQARQGRIQIEFVHRGLEPVLVTLDHVSNRIAFAIVLASLVLGSSVIVHSGIPPVWNGIPVIGLAGFVVAGIMAFWLLWSILRTGRM